MDDTSLPSRAVPSRRGLSVAVNVGPKHHIGGGHLRFLGGAPARAAGETAFEVARQLAEARATRSHDGTASQMNPWPRPLQKRLELLRTVRQHTGLSVAVALTEVGQPESVGEVADVVQLAAFHRRRFSRRRRVFSLDIMLTKEM